MRRLVLLAALLCAAAAPALTEAQVRAFVGRQERTWNAGDFGAYFAGFAPDAVFVDQARGNDNSIVPYGKSTLAQARHQARRAAAKGKPSEAGQVLRVQLGADGRSARVWSFEIIRAAGRTSCAERLQTLALRGGRLVSTGQTDTIVRCRQRL
jgi:hypothetical protein